MMFGALPWKAPLRIVTRLSVRNGVNTIHAAGSFLHTHTHTHTQYFSFDIGNQ